MSAKDVTGAVRVEGVSLQIDGKDILREVGFATTEARVGIVGRNGSGKTSLARVIAGLIDPSAGCVTVSGVDVAKDRKAALRSVGILFQNPDHQIIFPTVEEEIGFGLIQMGLSKAEAASQTQDMLRRFDKDHWAKAAVHLLSQGQKQLVCLMSVLAMDPAVILLDEPFSGLDLPTRAQLSRYLAKVGANIVHISHDPSVLRGYDRVIWLEQGCVVGDGPARQILAEFMRRMTELGGSDDISDIAG